MVRTRKSEAAVENLLPAAMPPRTSILDASEVAVEAKYPGDAPFPPEPADPNEAIASVVRGFVSDPDTGREVGELMQHAYALEQYAALCPDQAAGLCALAGEYRDGAAVLGLPRHEQTRLDALRGAPPETVARGTRVGVQTAGPQWDAGRHAEVLTDHGDGLVDVVLAGNWQAPMYVRLPREDLEIRYDYQRTDEVPPLEVPDTKAIKANAEDLKRVTTEIAALERKGNPDPSLLPTSFDLKDSRMFYETRDLLLRAGVEGQFANEIARHHPGRPRWRRGELIARPVARQGVLIAGVA